MNVGIDTSTFLLAAVIEDDEQLSCYVHESKDKNVDLRRAHLFYAAQQFFAEIGPGSVVFCEEPLALPKNGKTTRLLGLAAGAIWAAHVEYDVSWVWVDAAAWKGKEDGIYLADWKRAAGTRKDKEAVRAWGLAEAAALELPRHLTSTMERYPDLYDAWAILRWGQKRMRANLGDAPGKPQKAGEV